MRQQQFIRFVEEICSLLRLSQACSKTALQYFMHFKEYQGHNFDHEIMIGACIYLTTKIFEEEVRLRDILNMIYVLTTLYKLAREELQQKNQQKKLSSQINQKKSIVQNTLIQKQNQQNELRNKIEQENQKNANIQNQQDPQQTRKQQFILLKNIQKHPNLEDIIQPKYSLSDYNEYKSKIIEAEQTLLRILGFDFSLSEKNKTELKQLLLTFHYLHIPPTVAETILKVYNDLQYIDAKLWLQGVIYFGFLLVKNLVQINQNNASKQQKVSQTIEPNLQKNFSSQVRITQKDNNRQSGSKKQSERYVNQRRRIMQFVQKMSPSSKWQFVLNTSMKQLQNYAEKLVFFYSNIELS